MAGEEIEASTKQPYDVAQWLWVYPVPSFDIFIFILDPFVFESLGQGITARRAAMTRCPVGCRLATTSSTFMDWPTCDFGGAGDGFYPHKLPPLP